MAKLGFVETDRVETGRHPRKLGVYMKDLWLVLRSSARLARESIAVIADNRRPMNDPLGSDAKIRVAEHARQTLMAWRSGSNDPPEADHDRESLATGPLGRALRGDPRRPRDVVGGLTRGHRGSEWSQLGMVGLWPFHALLAVGGDAIQTKAFEAARTDPKVAGLVVMGMEMVIGDDGRVWSGLTETVRRLGLETAVAANARVAEATAASSEGDDPSGLAGLLGVRPRRASGCE